MNKQIHIWWPGIIYQTFMLFMNIIIGLTLISSHITKFLETISHNGLGWWYSVHNKYNHVKEQISNKFSFMIDIVLSPYIISRRYLKNS